MTYIEMIVEAIGQVKSGAQGASRQAIAKYVASKHKKEQDASFNAHLRMALKKGVADGVLRQGNSAQRFKLGDKSTSAKAKKAAPKKKKAAASKKKTAPKKKSTTKKSKKTKKSAPAKKKKTPSKKTKASSVKSTRSNKSNKSPKA
jgi:hypothetical protein